MPGPALQRLDPPILQRHRPSVPGSEAEVIIGEVRAALATWRDTVGGLGPATVEVDLLEDAIGA